MILKATAKRRIATSEISQPNRANKTWLIASILRLVESQSIKDMQGLPAQRKSLLYYISNHMAKKSDCTPMMAVNIRASVFMGGKLLVSNQRKIRRIKRGALAPSNKNAST